MVLALAFFPVGGGCQLGRPSNTQAGVTKVGQKEREQGGDDVPRERKRKKGIWRGVEEGGMDREQQKMTAVGAGG